MDDNHEYAFTTNEEVAAAVRSMRSDLIDHLPPVIWETQIDQLSSGVRNHIEALGHDTLDMSLVHGMLYGTMLAINLEAQTSEVSTSTVMLASVLLDMIEHPTDLDSELLSQLRSAVDRPDRARGVRRWISQMIRALLRSVL